MTKNNLILVLTLVFVMLSMPMVNAQSYSTLTPTKDYIPTITIDNQVWCIYNLNVSTFKNGDSILQAKTPEEWVKASDKKRAAWCYYNNDPTNREKYGKLYNWYAVNDPRGLAPKGYHVPSANEWLKLSQYVSNGESFSGTKGGKRNSGGSFGGIGEEGAWWSSTIDNGSATSWYQLGTMGSVAQSLAEMGDGMSVRCIKN